MTGNSFGKLFKISTFGESHCKAIGVVIDGCPSGLEFSEKEIQLELDRRKPGQSKITTQRKESDTVEILSGIFEGKTLGTPIALLIENKDQKSKDYSNIKDTFRPSHADFTYEEKYGLRDYRGGGRASARETAARVAAGAIAKKLLLHKNIQTTAFVSSIKNIALNKSYKELDFNKIENNIVRCPDTEIANQMIALIEETKDKGDSLGGIITCVVQNCPIGLGEPVFDKLEAQLAKAMLSIPAVKGFEIGSGFEGTMLYGSEHNDEFISENGKIVTSTNNSGGVQGGISNGMDIVFKVAFKPTATIMQNQNTVTKDGKKNILKMEGRHDPCVLPRAVPIVEAMANLVLTDLYLQSKINKL